MAFPQDQLAPLFEVYLGALGWVDITEDVRLAAAGSGGGWSITRGRQDEGPRADSGKLALVVNNRHGLYSDRNPRSEYYGILGQNTPIRMSLPQLADAGYLYRSLDGDVTTVDTPALDLTGDIDVRVDVALEDYAGAALVSKYDSTGDQRSWAFDFQATGKLGFYWSTTGTFATRIAKASTVAPTIPASGRLAVRVTLDVNNGAAGNTVTFYTAPTLAGPWTVLGDPVVTAGTTSIFSSSATVQLGREEAITVPFARGRFYGLEIRNGIGGTVVANPDFRNMPAGTTEFTDPAGRVWTVAGVASVFNPAYRFAGEVVAWPARWTLSQQDRWVPIQAAGILRRLGAGGDPLHSPIRRQFQSRSPVAYWPGEDDREAVDVSPALSGGVPAKVQGGSFAADDTLPGSGPLLQLAGIGITSFLGTVQMAAGNTEWSVAWFFKLTAVPAAGTPLMTIHTSGTVARWEVAATPATYKWDGYDASGVLVDNIELGFGAGASPDRWIAMQVSAIQVGSNVEWVGHWHEVGSETFFGTGFPYPSYAGTIGQVAQIQVLSSAGIANGSIGHIIVTGTELPFLTHDFARAAAGYVGELAGDRMIRLTGEEEVPFALIGEASDTMPMGPQKPLAFLDLMGGCADADMGAFGEQRGAIGLQYRTRTSLYNQRALPTDYTAGHISEPFEPAPDDQNVRNDITVSRTGGGSRRATLLTGRLSVLPPGQGGIGRYPDPVTVSVESDDLLEDIAGHLLAIGTVDEARYPQIHVDLSASAWAADPALTIAAAAVDTGDLVSVDGLPDWLPPGPTVQMAQGYTETGDGYDWDITWNTVPGSPWTVATADGDQRVPADGSTLAAVLVAPADAGGSNPGFETGTATPWFAASGTIAASTDFVRSGTYSGKLTANGSANPRATHSESATIVVAGRTYRISGWLYAPVALPGTASITIQWHAGAAFLSQSVLSTTLTAGVWTHLAAEVAAPPTATRAGRQYSMNGTPPVGRLLYGDDILIDEGMTFELDSTVENGNWHVGDTSTQPDDFPMLLVLGGPGGEVVEVEVIEAVSGGTQTVHMSQREVNGVTREWPAGTPVDVRHPAIVPL